MNKDELKNEIDKLRLEVDTLRSWKDSLNRRIESGLSDIGLLKTDKPSLPPSSTYTTNTGFRRTISLSGNAEDIVVPAYPVKFLKMSNANFYIPVHTFSEIVA